ncbi:MAG: aminopeptidase P family protein, partial [Ktedonobacterales bacterium]|nr:aminopeptidase P family protein [Ktedonobacterales bacterium]
MAAQGVPDLAEAVRETGLDGWLLYDFRRSNPIAHRVLNLESGALFSRRWFYYIPAQGEPTALISAVEPHVLSELPGQRRIFQTWNELYGLLRETLAGARRVAMEYSPDNAIPVTSWVDAGTVDWIRSLGIEVVSSANLAQRFEAVLSPAQIASHRDASQRILTARDALLDWVREELRADNTNLTEYTVQARFHELTHQQGLTFEHGHIVAVNAHAGDPHYETNRAEALP